VLKKSSKTAAKVLAGAAAPVFLYWLLISFPQPFFKAARFENLILYHHGEADPGAVGKRALAKIKASSLYDPTAEYRVFLTGSAREYAFYTSLWRGSGGVFLIFARGNIFIRPSNVDEDRLIAPSGETVAADRPLNYFIAHETAHAMACDRIGSARYNALEEWVREGLADRIARDGFDFEEMLGNYRRRLPMMDRRRSGLYLKYQLLVEYAIRHRGETPETLLEKNPPESAIEAELQKF
jgi:hypothetical protein